MNLQTSIAIERYKIEKDLIDLEIFNRLRENGMVGGLLTLQNDKQYETSMLMHNDAVEGIKCSNLKDVTPNKYDDTRRIPTE